LRSGASNRIGGARLVDRRLGQAQHHLGGQAVAHLAVDVVGAQHDAGQLRPRVRVLVGQPGPAQHSEGGRAVQLLDALQPVCRGLQGLVPADLDQVVALTHHRLGEPLVADDRFVAEPPLVAQPAVVHRLTVDAKVSNQPVGRRLHGHSASD
jgi:hypothetical protein